MHNFIIIQIVLWGCVELVPKEAIILVIGVNNLLSVEGPIYIYIYIMLNLRVGALIYVGGNPHQSTEQKETYSVLNTSLDLSGPI